MARNSVVQAPGAGEVTGSAPSSRDWATYRRLLGYVADQKVWFVAAIVGALWPPAARSDSPRCWA